MMRRPSDQKQPVIHTEFLARKFVVQTSIGTFKAVSPDMKLEQTINRSQKYVYVSERELVYHEILAISNYYSDLTKSKTSKGPTFHHQLASRMSKQLSEEIIKVRELITERGNPNETSRPTPLHNITSGLVVL